MAGKTIEIDDEIYELLCGARGAGQTFDEVIQEQFGARARKPSLLEVVRRAPLSDETLEAIESRISARQTQPATAPKL